MNVPPVPPAAAEPDTLGPVRDALLGLAHRDARRVLDAADADAAGTLAQAGREAEQIRAAARAEATADARTRLAAEESRINRDARAVELQARRAAYDELVRRAHVAVRALSDEPGLRQQLEGLARAELGADATMTASPDGGLVAELGGRRVSYLLSALAERAVSELLAGRDAT